MEAGAGALHADNPAQRLRSRFTSAGASVSSGGARIGLSLDAIGFGSRLEPLTNVAPRLQAHRVVYARPAASEWYANGPLGLEQGFTIAKPPPVSEGGPLTLSVALTGNTVASLTEHGTAVLLRRGGRVALRYSGLAAADARGRALHSWLSLEAGRLLVHVDAAGAHYPLRIDPFVQDGEKLTGSGESGEGRFGFSVALDAQGTIALIGAPADHGFKGAAWVFTRSGSTWTQQGSKLTGSGESGEGGFGYSVALDAEGDTAVIGAPFDATDLGAAFVFTRSNSTWSQQGEKLTGEGVGGGESGEGEFGYSVALSEDGNTALIGGAYDDGFTGAAWVFVRSAGKWTQQGSKLTGAGGEDVASFGGCVALSGDGDTALIGGPVANSSHGGAWVFTRSGSTWSQQGEELESSEGFAFGTSVALSGNGDEGLVGEPEDNNGVVWAYARSGSKWGHPKKLEVGGASFLVGRSVAIDGEGDTALLGGFEPGSEGYPEHAWEFTRSGSNWSQVGPALVPAGESGEGYRYGGIALAAQDGAAMMGVFNEAGSLTGSVWAFEPAAAPTVVSGAVTEPNPTSVVLNGTVNPNGATVSECKFEYGTTTTYGSSATCSASPGSGHSPVAVSAHVAGLAEGQTYHFRLTAVSFGGTGRGTDETLATLANSGSGNNKCTGVCSEEGEEPAEASDGPVSATASGGVGTVTVGQFGVNPGGVRLFASPAEYVDVYHTSSSSFSKIEYEDCELHGARKLYWFDPQAGAAGEWQLVTRQSYVPGSPACIDAVAEASGTSPTVTQMNGTRYGVAGAIEAPEFGRCVLAPESAQKKVYEGFFTAKTCLEKGTPGPAGEPLSKYEWDLDVLEEQPGQPAVQFTLAASAVKLETAEKAFKVACTGASGSGEYTGPKTIGDVALVLEGCTQGGVKCNSADAGEGEIKTSTLEGELGFESRPSKPGLELLPASGPFMAFSCNGTDITVRGGVVAPMKANKASATPALKFKGSKGVQKPEGFETGKATLEEQTGQGAYQPMSLSVSLAQSNERGEEAAVNTAY